MWGDAVQIQIKETKARALSICEVEVYAETYGKDDDLRLLHVMLKKTSNNSVSDLYRHSRGGDDCFVNGPFYALRPVSSVFSLAWLLASTKSFTWLVCRVVGSQLRQRQAMRTTLSTLKAMEERNI